MQDSRHENISVTLLDTETGKTVQRDDATYWYWTEGNGSCDCNRAIPFDVEDPNEDPETGCSVCMGCKRFLVIKADGYSLAEFNHHYPVDLVRKHVEVPAEEFGEHRGMFTHADLAAAYKRIHAGVSK